MTILPLRCSPLETRGIFREDEYIAFIFYLGYIDIPPVCPMCKDTLLSGIIVNGVD